MNTTTNKVKLSITLNPGIANKLPKVNRSQFIESVLVAHFQNEGFEKLYARIRQRLLDDPEFRQGTGIETEATYPPCCSRYPDYNCGHWTKDYEGDQLINKKTGEVVVLT